MEPLLLMLFGVSVVSVVAGAVLIAVGQTQLGAWCLGVGLALAVMFGSALGVIKKLADTQQEQASYQTIQTT